MHKLLGKRGRPWYRAAIATSAAWTRAVARVVVAHRTRMLEVGNRIVMVSGASRGIGHAVVDRLLASSFRVSAGLRDPGRLEESERLMTHRYDAENAESPISWVKATVARWGETSILEYGRKSGSFEADSRKHRVG